MVTTNPEQQEREELPEATTRTASERLAAVEAQQNALLGEMRENARRADENYRSLNDKIDATARENIARTDALGNKIDRSHQAPNDKIDATSRESNDRTDALGDKIDQSYQALGDKIDQSYQALSDKIDAMARENNDKHARLLYTLIGGFIGLGVLVIATNYLPS